jgi:primosomal replication protein N
VTRNRVELSAVIAEVKSLRFTPAGLPALDLLLDHESSVQEAGNQRDVKAAVKAVAFGAMAERLARQPLGSVWFFSGFLGAARNAKGVVLHIQAFEAIHIELNPSD